MSKKPKFVSGEIFHVFNRSIAGFKIFDSVGNSQRFIETLDYYNNLEIKEKFSRAKNLRKYFFNNLMTPKPNSKIKIISYCIMPDHYHMLVKILEDSSFSKYINDIENSFTRYFNIRFRRKGPLWESSFKTVRINTNEQLLHVSRYIHLNPTSSNLVTKPEDWELSSYNNFIKDQKYLKEILTEISIKSPKRYKSFVENNINYQKKLKFIRKLMID